MQLIIKRISVIVGLVLALTSCANTNRSPINNTVIDNPNNRANAAIKLSEAAVSVSQSLQQLAATEKAANPPVKVPPPPNPASIGMASLGSVDWAGPIEPLVRKIATATNYRVRVLGKSPAIPVIVSISEQNVLLADILRDISYQAHNKATIVLYPSSRVIELRYIS